MKIYFLFSVAKCNWNFFFNDSWFTISKNKVNHCCDLLSKICIQVRIFFFFFFYASMRKYDRKFLKNLSIFHFSIFFTKNLFTKLIAFIFKKSFFSRDIFFKIVYTFLHNVYNFEKNLIDKKLNYLRQILSFDGKKKSIRKI